MFSTWNIQFRPFYKLKFQIQHGLHGDCLKCHCSLITNTTVCFVLNLLTVMFFCLVRVDNWNMALIVTLDHLLTSLFSLPVYRCFVYLFLPLFYKVTCLLCPGGHSFCVPWANDVEYKMEWISFLNMELGKM